MDDVLTQHAEAYALNCNLRLAERLGHGIHGIVYAAESNSEPGNIAIKAHRSEDGYFRERDAYLRLRKANVEEILGLHVPRLIRFEDRLWIIEMTIVSRPFLLDFAGAYLDRLPQFSDEIWQEWESQKRDQFEHRWPRAREVMDALEQWDIYMIDVSPSNIAFLD
jgi:hypothetical protein